MINKQSGFSAVETIVIVAVVAMLGGLGWFVWDKNKSQQTNSAKSSQQAEPSSNDEVDEAPAPTYDTAKVAKIKNFEQASASLKKDLVGKFYDTAKKQCDAENAQVSAEEQHPYYLYMNKMVRDDFAAVLFCPSGGTSILAKVSGAWELIGSLADTPGCSLVDDYKISKEITATCTTTSLQTKEVIYP